MKDAVIETVQQAASGKAATAVVAATATHPMWIDAIRGEAFQASIVILGIFVSISILLVNIQAYRNRGVKRKEESRVFKEEQELRKLQRLIMERKLKDDQEETP